MIGMFPWKLWSTTVYRDKEWEGQSSYSQSDTIYHMHTSGICAIIAILDPSTEADENFLNKNDGSIRYYAN